MSYAVTKEQRREGGDPHHNRNNDGESFPRRSSGITLIKSPFHVNPCITIAIHYHISSTTYRRNHHPPSPAYSILISFWCFKGPYIGGAMAAMGLMVMGTGWVVGQQSDTMDTIKALPSRTVRFMRTVWNVREKW